MGDHETLQVSLFNDLPVDIGQIPTKRLRKRDYEVRNAPFKQCQYMVSKLHYAKGGSNTYVYMHGLYKRNGKELMGAAWWLPPTRVACESVNKKNWKRVLGLTRLVCRPDAPRNSASFLISGSIKLIKIDGRFDTLVTYADESQGHTGSIYKASNWEYFGRTGPYPRWLDSNGRQVSAKSTLNRKKAEMEALGYTKQGAFHKHKYIMNLEN